MKYSDESYMHGQDIFNGSVKNVSFFGIAIDGSVSNNDKMYKMVSKVMM